MSVFLCLTDTYKVLLIFVSDDELRDLPEESLLYSPEKTEQNSGDRCGRTNNEIVSCLLICKLTFVLMM